MGKGQPIERAAAMRLRTAVMQEIAAKREGWAGPNRRLARQTARRVLLLMVYSVNLRPNQMRHPLRRDAQMTPAGS